MKEPLQVHEQGRSPLYQGFQECCKAVLASGSRGAGMSFAKSYAQAGLHLSTSSGIKTQANYILANLSGWRDKEAKDVRETLKKIAKGEVARPARSSEAGLRKSLLSLKELALGDLENE